MRLISKEKGRVPSPTHLFAFDFLDSELRKEGWGQGGKKEEADRREKARPNEDFTYKS